jgi:hemolysin activation/secretion protein
MRMSVAALTVSMVVASNLTSGADAPGQTNPARQAEVAQMSTNSNPADRPSGRPLPAPGFAPQGTPPGFVLPPVPEAAPGSSELGRKIAIRQIVLRGNTVIPRQVLEEMVRPYVGREVTVGELEDLRQRLTQVYIDAGYVNSGVVIPPDALIGGELRFQFIEGRLKGVNVKGQGRLRKSYIVNRLAGDPDEPFTLTDLQDRFQVLLGDPLIARMNGRVVPGKSLGEALLDVEVTRARPYYLSLFGNNYRPVSIGAEAAGLNAGLRNLTGLGDLIDFTYVHSEGGDRYSGGYVVPVSDIGTKAFVTFDEGQSVIIEETTKDLNLNSRISSLEGGLVQALLNSPDQLFQVGISLSTRQSQMLIGEDPFLPGTSGADNKGRSFLTVWRLTQDYQQRWDRHALAIRSTFNVGMDAFGATRQRGSEERDSEFFSWLGQGNYVFRVFDNGTQLALRGLAQFTNDPLLPLEQIAVGGVNTVRGYRENQLVRDNGYAVSAEFRIPLIKPEDGSTRHSLALIPFLDYGQAWDHHDQRNSLFSVGVGMNWTLKPLEAEIYYGHKLKDVNREGKRLDIQDDGVHFQLRLTVL